MILDLDPLSGLLALRASPMIRDLHEEQRKVLRLQGRWRGVRAGRRSGKSYLAAVWLLGGDPNRVSLYCARTLKSAKAILLPVLSELNARYQLGLTIRTIDGEVICQNGHVIRFHGLKDRAAADLLRGQKFQRVFLDEAGAFDDDLLRYAIEAVITHTLTDWRGEFMIGGTPGLVPSGYFFELVGDREGSGKEGRWPSHTWDLRQNPSLPGTPEERVADQLAINSWTIDHPTFRREVLAQWVDDAESKIYHYQGERWATPPDAGYSVLGVDLAGGTSIRSDDTTFVVTRQDPAQRPHVFVLHAERQHGIDVGQVAERIRELRGKYRVGKIVIDGGGLGAMVVNTLKRTYAIDCESVAKGKYKRPRIEVAQAGLRRKEIHLCEGAKALWEEWLTLAWDETRQTHHERCADDLSDAFLYALLEHLAVAPVVQLAPVVSDEERARGAARLRAQRRTTGGSAV